VNFEVLREISLKNAVFFCGMVNTVVTDASEQPAAHIFRADTYAGPNV
jgi:hypothetical protein